MRGEYEPPYLPEVSSETDVQNFDTMFTSRTPRESNNANMSQETQDQVDGLNFEDFDYVAEEFLDHSHSDDAAAAGSKEAADDRRSSCGGATTSGVSSGASSVSHSVSADSLDSSAKDEAAAKPSPKKTTADSLQNDQQPVQNHDEEDPEINELRICSHGS